jgi:integrase
MKKNAITEPEEFPVHVTGDPTNITIYKETHDGENRYMVSYYDASCSRHRQRCTTYVTADAFALKLKKEIKAGGWDLLTLRGAEKHSYERARELLRPCAKPLDLAIHEYVEASKVLNGFGLMEAARAFIQRQADKVTPKLVVEIVPELIDDLKRKGRSKFYLRDLRTRLGRFGEKFACPLSSISTAEIDSFIHDLTGKERYRNNVLQAIGTLFTFGRKRGYAPRDHCGVNDVTRYEVKGKEIEVLTPAELEKMLLKANPQVQLALALTCFAGVRGSELGRLDWNDVKFEAGFIRVKAASSKTGMRRVPPITDNLRAWLMLHRKESGPIVPYKNIYNQYPKVASKAGIHWKRNGHRHGFASYRSALIKNLEQVAIEAGHSKQMLLSNYFQVVSEQDAKAWFSIYPPGYPKPMPPQLATPEPLPTH